MHAINFRKINPQIDGFNGNIYDPNLKIDVFDPYFYQVMITRFYFYAFEIQKTPTKTNLKSKKGNQIKSSSDKEIIFLINNIYGNNLQKKTKEFFSMIHMPDKDDSKYKEAWVRVFLLTIFELNYNYASSCCLYNNIIKYVIRDINNGNDASIVNKTFFKYFLEDSEYKNDFVNFIEDNDFDNLELPFNEITYLFPQSITKAFEHLLPYPKSTNQVKTYFYDTNIFKVAQKPDYDDKTLAKITIKNPFSLLLRQDDKYNYCYPMFMHHKSIFGYFWNILQFMDIYYLTFNDQTYYPRVVHSKHKDYKYFNDENTYKLFEEYSQHLGNKIIADIINGKYMYSLVGYLIYKDNLELTKSSIYSYTSLLGRHDPKKFIELLLEIINKKDKYFDKFNNFNKKLTNIDKNIDIILEVSINLIDKISPVDAYRIYRDFLKDLYKNKPSHDSKQKKNLLNFCEALNKRALSIL